MTKTSGINCSGLPLQACRRLPISRQQGFTLIELLVVVAIIVIVEQLCFGCLPCIAISREQRRFHLKEDLVRKINSRQRFVARLHKGNLLSTHTGGELRDVMMSRCPYSVDVGPLVCFCTPGAARFLHPA